ncbi:signal peptidase I [Acidimicrobiia bacterium EGI L10123]|uniref:signal peptidase I n=1 Tax=Salinilacustrithrix flava TaxID=2957203 RepID=UPI003D7C190A|nr:signal peptidase I [Acidimicrobiia bacterium EGI L10123]
MRKIALLAFLTLALVGVLGLRHKVVSDVDLFAVESGSMGDAAPIGSLVVVRPAESAVVGDVVTYEKERGVLLTHRVIEVTPTGEYRTQGDANDGPDPWTVEPGSIRGVVESVHPGWGYALVFLSLPMGIGSIAAAVVALALLWQLFFPPDAADGATSGEASRSRRSRHRPAPAG